MGGGMKGDKIEPLHKDTPEMRTSRMGFCYIQVNRVFNPRNEQPRIEVLKVFLHLQRVHEHDIGRERERE